jgi:hypothetical protein
MSMQHTYIFLFTIVSILTIDGGLELYRIIQGTTVSAFSVVNYHQTNYQSVLSVPQGQQYVYCSSASTRHQCYDTFYQTTARTTNFAHSSLLMSSSNMEKQDINDIPPDEDIPINDNEDNIDAESILRIQRRESDEINIRGIATNQRGGFSFASLERMRESDDNDDRNEANNGIESSYSVAARKTTSTTASAAAPVTSATTGIKDEYFTSSAATSTSNNDENTNLAAVSAGLRASNGKATTTKNEATTAKKILLSTEVNVQNQHDKVTSTLETTSTYGNTSMEKKGGTVNTSTDNLKLKVIEQQTSSATSFPTDYEQSNIVLSSDSTVSDIVIRAPDQSAQVQQDLHYMRMAINLALEEYVILNLVLLSFRFVSCCYLTNFPDFCMIYNNTRVSFHLKIVMEN